MKFSKIAAAFSLVGAVMAAQAVPTITNVDGVLSPFGGFDWDSGGAAYSKDLNAAVGGANGGLFTITYVAWAAHVTCSSGSSCTNLTTPGLDTNANGAANGTYEYTIYATLQGQVTGISSLFGQPVIEYTILPTSTFNIYYDTTPEANAAAGGNWSGFQDGTAIITGNLQTSGSGGAFITALGTNSIALFGTVSNTDSNYVNPALTGTSISSTLQLFGFDTVTNFNAPTSVQGDALGCVQTSTNPTCQTLLFQADANQTFPIPEPTGLVLTGSALAALGALTRRRRKN